MPIFCCRSFKPPQATSRPGPPGRRQAGFTIIEILAVLLIVTIMTGLVVARLPAFASSADVDRETRRLELLLKMARTDAVLDSIEYGFRRTDKGYMFLRYDDGSQAWIPANHPFHERTLDDVELTLLAESADNSSLGRGVPPVLILSSGELTPFTLELSDRSGAVRHTIEGELYGDIRRVTDDE